MKAAPVCGVCDRPVLDGGYVCWPDTDRIGTAMAFVVECADQLDLVIAKQTRGAPAVGGRSAETPLPFNAFAADTAWTVRHTLTAWVKHVTDTRGINPPADTLGAMAGFLRDQLKWVRCQPDAATAFDELDYASWLLRTTIDSRPGHTYLGPCNTTTEDGVCAADLRAIIGASHARCRECGARHDVGMRKRWLLRHVHDRLETAPVIASIVSALSTQRLPIGTIKSWIHRRRLIKRGHDGTGRPLYRLGDAIDLTDRATHKEKT